MPRRAYQDTEVSPYRTQDQLDSLLSKYGVEVTRWTMYPDLIRFEFQEQGIGYRVDVPVPPGRDQREREQLRREKARVLFYYMKAKLTAAESGVADIQREFLPFMITGDNRVFFQEVEDAMHQGKRVLQLGAESPLLPAGRDDLEPVGYELLEEA